MKDIEVMEARSPLINRIIFPFLGFYLLLLLGVTISVFSFAFTDGYVTVKRLILFPGMILYFCLWLAAVAECRDSVFYFRWTGLFLGGFLALSFFSLLFSINPHDGIRQCQQLLVFFMIYCIAAGTPALFPKKIGPVLTLVLIGLIVASYGIIQYLHKESLFRLPVLEKAVSTFGNTNVAGQFIILILPLTFSLVFVCKSLWTKIIFSAVALAQLSYLFMTRSRSSWVGLMAGLLMMAAILLWQRKKRRFRLFGWREIVILLVILCLIFLFLLFSDSYLKRIAVVDTGTLADMDLMSNRFRILSWQATWQMCLAHPLSGVGAGNFPVAYPYYRTAEEMKLPNVTGKAVNSPHNDYLNAAAETGFPGLVLFTGAVLLALLSIIRCMGESLTDRKNYLLSAGGVCAAAAFAVSAIFNFPFQNPALGAVFWFIAGLTGRSWTLWTWGPGRKVVSRSLWLRLLFLYVPLLLLGLWGIFMFSAPARADFYLKKGMNYRWRGNGLAAIEAVKKSVGIYPYWAEQHLLLGRYYEENHMLDHAIEYYERGIALNPTHARAHFFTGGVYGQKGQWNQAVSAYKTSIRFDPFFPKAFYNLGKIYERTGRLDEAFQNFTLAVGLDNSMAEPFYALGNIMYVKREYMSAAIYWEKFLARMPDFPEADALREKIDDIRALMKEKQLAKEEK